MIKKELRASLLRLLFCISVSMEENLLWLYAPIKLYFWLCLGYSGLLLVLLGPCLESKRRSESEERKPDQGSAFALNHPGDFQVGLIALSTENHSVSGSLGISCECWSCGHLQNIGQPSALFLQPAKGTAFRVTQLYGWKGITFYRAIFTWASKVIRICIGFVLLHLAFKNLAPLFHTISSKTRPNCDSLVQFFPSFFLIGSLECPCPLWLAEVMTMVLGLRHSMKLFTKILISGICCRTRYSWATYRRRIFWELNYF